MTTLSFSGVTIQCYQAGDLAYDVQTKQARLYSGKIYVRVSTVTSFFPRSFSCHTDTAQEIEDIAALIGTFGTLVIDGTSYENCYIASLSSIKELSLGSGKFTFNITFGKADYC